MIPPVVSLDEVAALATDATAVVFADVRWYLDGRSGRAAFEAGHIPGARNAPWAGSLSQAAGTFKSAAELRQHYGDLGAQPERDVVCYCGSGVSACANLLGLERAGWTDTRLYVASWSGWSADPERPVATGP